MQSADGVFYHRADILHSILEKLKLPLFSPLANQVTIVIKEFHAKISTEQLHTAISRIFSPSYGHFLPTNSFVQ